MKLEIVSHCWRYSRLLKYQLSSLVLYPPAEVDVLMTVFLAEADCETVDVVEYFSPLLCSERVRLRRWSLPEGRLFIRGIGRNLAGLATEADWVWFADCDFFFGAGALDALGQRTSQTDAVLVYPRSVLGSRSPAVGDLAIAAASGPPRVLDLPAEDFAPMRFSRAIGGVQIARGDVVRRLGYCRDSAFQHRNSSRWQEPREDVTFRRSLGTKGTPIDLPNVYRVRHTRGGGVA
ncbi:MAG: glycosyltransferase family 2 protein [Pirellulales bacterium]|nr:glycosyltransferase family 2 protein [Pirellulales bacterium]